MPNTNTSPTLLIGTRGSRLALWQAKYTQQALAAIGVPSELHIIKTKGDRLQHLSFDKIEGKGFFTKEIEDALLAGDIHLAVHSMKDLPTTMPEGLAITAVSQRANPADWLLLRPQSTDTTQSLDLKPGAIVGTSSARRKAQLLDLRPDIQLQDIRGNVPTRLEKLQNGSFDAIMLAAAGLERLQIDLSHLHTVPLSPREFVPAPAQGVLAFQTRKEDTTTRCILQDLHQPDTSAVTNIERKALQLLDGGCHTPFGAYCERDAAGHYHCWAAYAPTWQSPLQRAQYSSSTRHHLAERLLENLQKT